MKRLRDDKGIGPGEFISRLVKGMFEGGQRNSAMPMVEFWTRREAARGGDDYVR